MNPEEGRRRTVRTFADAFPLPSQDEQALRQRELQQRAAAASATASNAPPASSSTASSSSSSFAPAYAPGPLKKMRVGQESGGGRSSSSSSSSASASASASSSTAGLGRGRTGGGRRGVRTNLILVRPSQEGNPLLGLLRSAQFEFDHDLLPDYELGPLTCALYLSLKYHTLHPKYIQARMDFVRQNYRVRVLLCHVDMDDHEHALQEVTRLALVNKWTLMCAFSTKEAARYLETIKVYEHKPADMIKEHTPSQEPKLVFARALQKIRSVNKTDVATLAATFGSLAAVANASHEQLAQCPGLGPAKVKRIYDAFHRSLLGGGGAAARSSSSSSSGKQGRIDGFLSKRVS